MRVAALGSLQGLLAGAPGGQQARRGGRVLSRAAPARVAGRRVGARTPSWLPKYRELTTRKRTVSPLSNASCGAEHAAQPCSHSFTALPSFTRACARAWCRAIHAARRTRLSAPAHHITRTHTYTHTPSGLDLHGARSVDTHTTQARARTPHARAHPSPDLPPCALDTCDACALHPTM